MKEQYKVEIGGRKIKEKIVRSGWSSDGDLGGVPSPSTECHMTAFICLHI